MQKAVSGINLAFLAKTLAVRHLSEETELKSREEEEGEEGEGGGRRRLNQLLLPQ